MNNYNKIIKEYSNNNTLKTISIIIGIFLVVGIGILAFIFLNNPEPVGKCGDGVCDAKEKLNSDLCPEDCEKTCSELGGNICFSSQTCSGSWLDASDGARCCDGECETTEKDIPYYFIAIHCEPYGANEKNYEALKNIIDYANDYNVKLTLQFTAQWADYISKDEQRMDELKQWEMQGHEIAAHHHSIDHPGNWDGYTDFSKEETIEASADINLFRGDMKEYIKKLKQINPNINSGCMNGDTKPKKLTDFILYATCAGSDYANFDNNGERLSDDDANKGKNEFILTKKINDIGRYYLSHAHVFNEGQPERAIQIYDSMDRGVYGAVAHAKNKKIAKDLINLEKFIDYLHIRDSDGNKSVTVSEVIKQNLLPEKLMVDYIPYYFISIHVNPLRLREGQNPKNYYTRTVQMVDKANLYDIKLSLMFSGVIADYIAESPERMNVLEQWKQQGHEIAAHHHDIHHKGNWDGYTSYSEEEAIARRIQLGEYPPGPKDPPEHYIGTLNEVAEKFEKINLDVKSCACNEGNDKMTMPDNIEYGINSGYAHFGEIGTRLESDSNPYSAINEYIIVSEVSGKQKKFVDHALVTDKTIQGIKNMFSSKDSSIIFGVVLHNSKHEVELFNDFIEFLAETDPDATKSITISEAIESGIVPEVEIELTCSAQGSTSVCSASETCSGFWIWASDTNRCCNGECR